MGASPPCSPLARPRTASAVRVAAAAGVVALCALLLSSGAHWGAGVPGGLGAGWGGNGGGSGGGDDPGKAQMALDMLQLGNPGLLSAAALVDGAARTRRGRGQLRRMVQLQQELYCRARMHTPDPPGSARVERGGFTQLLYNASDFVSSHIKTADWESKVTNEIKAALKVPVPASPGDKNDVARWQRALPPAFLDVGANIGWFTLNMAAAGAHVSSFEAMASNVRLVRASLCSSPGIADRVALFATGLGPERNECVVISDAANVGDGHTICNKDGATAVAEWKKNTGRTYEVRGQMSTVRLDSAIDHDVQVMKMDVEGFEGQVLKGATGLFTAHNVWFIVTECRMDLLGESSPAHFLKQLDSLGFYISQDSFQGPFFSPEKVRAGGYNSTSADLYLVNKKLHDAAVKAAGAGSEPSGAGGDWYSDTAGGGGDAGVRAAAAWKQWFKSKVEASA